MSTETTTSVGALLREYRLAAGLTQEVLAERAGIAVRSVQAIEAGTNRPQPETARRLAAALGLLEDERARLLALATPSPRLRSPTTRPAMSAPTVPQPNGPTKTHAGQSPEAVPRNPYKGLRAYRGEDAADFFGRASLVAELVAAIQSCVQPGAARFLAVVGPSGSGKSSVVLAGLLPRLRHGTVAGSAGWAYLDPMVSGDHPLEALSITLANALPGSSVTAIRADLDASARGLHLLAGRLAHQPETRVLLVVDQAEELFTLAAEEERWHFIDLLTTAVCEPRGTLLALLTLRADFYDRPLAYSQFGRLVTAQSVAVLPLEPDELRAAIEGPAALPDVGLRFEGSLASELLYEVREQAGALPLLQFTLEQLYERREGRLLTEAAYRALGGVRGALARHAEATYQGLPSEEHRHLARVLLLRLIEPGANAQETTRRRASLAELELADPTRTARLRTVAEAFITARLLTALESGGTTTLEVSHEALIREWERLGAWLHAAREDVRVQIRLSADAAEWRRRSQPLDRLYRGTVLAEARSWAARNTPSAREEAFLAAAAAEERRQSAAEGERQARELAVARQAATRLRVLVSVLAVSLLAAATLIVWAQNNAYQADSARKQAQRARQQAVRERDLALSRQLAAQAMAHLDDRYDLALLLGLEARKAADTVEARSSLLAAVESHPAGLITFLQGHDRDVGGLALSPDGAILASGGADGMVRLWDPTRLRSLGPPLQGDASAVNGLAFSPDGMTLAASHADGMIWLWDVVRRRPLGQPWRGDPVAVYGVAFSPDGKTLAAANFDGTILLWDVARRRLRGSNLGIAGGSSIMNAVAFSPDGRLLASADVRGIVQVWDTAAQVLVAPVDVLTGSALAVAFSPNGKVLAYAGIDGTVRLWDVEHRRTAGKPLIGHVGPVNCLAFSPDGRVLASGGVDKTVRLWDVARHHPLGQPLQSHTGAVESLAFRRDGKVLFAGTEDGALAAWDATGRQAHGQSLISNPSTAIWSVAFSTDGKRLAAGSGTGTIIQSWGVPKGGPLAPGVAPLGSGPLVFRPDSKVLVAKTIQPWASQRQQQILSLLAPPGNAMSIAYGPNGKLLATGGMDGMLQFWDAAHEKPLGPPLRTELGRVLVVVFSPDGTLLAAAGDSTVIQLWDVAHRRLLEPLLLGHTSGVDSLAFSPDGTMLASTGWDLTVRLWDVASRQPLGLPLAGHTARVTSVTFSPDGKLVASGSWDGTVRLSSVDVGPACRIANRNLTMQEWRQYLPGLPYQKTCPGLPAGS